MTSQPFDPGPPSQWMKTLSNWGRWGDDDERGTLNLITPEKRHAAAASVTEGVTVSCALPITYATTPDQPSPTRRYMLSSGEAHSYVDRPITMAADAFLIAPHGF